MRIRQFSDEIIDKYKAGISAYKLAKIYNCTESGILKVLSKNSINRRTIKENKKYQVNENYFREIDTPEKAYFLGLLFSDGNNNEKTGVVRISLQEEDSYILDTFNKYIYQNDRPLYHTEIKGYKSSSCLAICNRTISNDLKILGCVGNKSLTLDFPNINNNFIKHFIRGYFDGDGSAIVDARGNFTFQLIGTKKFITKTKEILSDSLSLNDNKICKNIKNKKNPLYVLRYSSKKDCLKLREWLYEETEIFLKRKFNKFQQIKETDRKSETTKEES